MNKFRQSRIIALCIVLATVGVVSGVSAKEPEYKYFETLTNCNGGGWLVVYEDGGGQTSIAVLCDGGTNGTPQ